jgi:hypothetical protein
MARATHFTAGRLWLARGGAGLLGSRRQQPGGTMTYAAAATRPAFNIGRVIGRAFEILGRNFWKLVGLCLLALVISVLVSMAGAVAVAAGGKDTPPALSVVFGVLNLVVGVMQFAFIWGAVTYAGVAQVEGRPAPFSECFSNGLRTMLPITGLFVLSMLGLFASYVVFVIPAIIVSLMWSVTAQALAVERISIFEAFSRSVALTRDNRMAIFGLNILASVGMMVFVGVAFAIFGGLIAGFGQTLDRPRTTAEDVGSVIWVIALSALNYLSTFTIGILANACLQTSVYAELRYIKEGGMSAATVFD